MLKNEIDQQTILENILKPTKKAIVNQTRTSSLTGKQLDDVSAVWIDYTNSSLQWIPNERKANTFQK